MDYSLTIVVTVCSCTVRNVIYIQYTDSRINIGVFTPEYRDRFAQALYIHEYLNQ
jgi:hypothetical protein